MAPLCFFPALALSLFCLCMTGMMDMIVMIARLFLELSPLVNLKSALGVAEELHIVTFAMTLRAK